jgi:hypothetical protein
MLQDMNTIPPMQGVLSCHCEQPAMRCNATHHSQMVAGLEDSQDRRWSAWCIGSDRGGQEIKTRFIHQNKGSVFQTRFCFVSNHISFRQRVISPSARWIAPSIGCWGVHFSSLSTRAPGERWYVTPHSHSSTLRTRGHVHTAPRTPDASAPCPRKSGISRFSSLVSSGRRPVCGRACKLALPLSATLLHQRLTAPALTSNAVAISRCFQPLLFNFMA